MLSVSLSVVMYFHAPFAFVCICVVMRIKKMPYHHSLHGYKKQQFVTYLLHFCLQSLLPYYDSMNNSLKELLARAVKKKGNQNVLSKK